jgi:hypothetical protein
MITAWAKQVETASEAAAAAASRSSLISLMHFSLMFREAATGPWRRALDVRARAAAGTHFRDHPAPAYLNPAAWKIRGPDTAWK